MESLSRRALFWAAPTPRRRRAAGRIVRTISPLLPRVDPPKRPIFILGAPRSGTTALFEVLDRSPVLASLERETGVVWDLFHPLDALGWVSHEISPEMIAPNEPRAISWAIDRMTLGKRYLDKLPRNCLRIAYLDALFPDASFVFLRRDGRAVVSSLMTGWVQGVRFGRGRTPPIPMRIDGYEGTTWKFLVPPGWEEYATDVTLAQVCAFQWVATNEAILRAKPTIDPSRWSEVSYEELITSPVATVERLLTALDLPRDPEVLDHARDLDSHVTKKAVTPPSADKWRREHPEEVASILAQIAPMMRTLGYDAS